MSIETSAEASAETKLSAARTKLILDKPFLGALVLRLPVEAGDSSWCPTTATDARGFYYNPEYIDNLSSDHVQFVLAHEALHCALSHFARRGHREKKRWDMACDLAVNDLLVKDGLEAPPGALIDLGFDGLTAEEIYPALTEQIESPMDRHLYDDQEDADHDQKEVSGKQQELTKDAPPREGGTAGGDQNEKFAPGGPPGPLSPDERENLSTQWQQRLAGAAQVAMQAGKLSGVMTRFIDHLLQPQLPWRNLLAHHVSNIARDDYSYARPSTRRGDPALYPSLRSAQINVTVALDTSGSIKDDDIKEFLTEIDAIKSQMRARITLHACDVSLAADGPWLFEPWDEISLPREFTGGGGTDFSPVFTWSDKQDQSPDMLVYFTDAEGEFPEQEPLYPVLWLVKGKSSVPWGIRVQLN